MTKEVLTELFDYYIKNKVNIKPTTIDSLKYTRNRLEFYFINHKKVYRLIDEHNLLKDRPPKS